MTRTFVCLMMLVLFGAPQTVWAQDEAEQTEETEAPATQPAAVQPVDFRKLKELMPEQLVDLKRTDVTGQKLNMGDVKLSQAHASYEGGSEEEPSSVNVDVTDYGAQPDMVEGMAYWKEMEMDQESDEGYQRTVKIGQWPALESYQNEGKSGSLHVFVADRFLVLIDISNLPAEQTLKIAEQLQLDKLAELK